MPRKANNPQNLIPAKKGEVRNPNGKAKGALDKKTILNKWLEFETIEQCEITGENQKLSQIEIVLLRCLKEARGGNMQAIKELFDRYFGKEKEQIDHTIKEPFKIVGGEDLTDG